ncbi:MAG: RluA family pseudouridine synthase, partial [Rhodospirillaceae bacterium]|nr:RluA family pseudouridine synthase [Rhodospirillaceae bacterium]
MFMNDIDNNPNPPPRTYTVEVPAGKDGERLDKVLADALAGNDISRARVQALLGEGCVVLVGKTDTPLASRYKATLPARHKVREGDSYIVTVPAPISATPEPEDIALDIIFEDDDVIVIDKPPGMVVHPAAGNANGTLVNALLHHCKGSLSGIGGVVRPGIVHRLDKGTGGLMIAAKNDGAHHSLANQFSEHIMERAYFALVWGVPMPREGEIRGNIGRSPSNRKKMAVLKRGGKQAKTHYRVIKAFGTGASLVECVLATGRTHQIRVHMASIGHPVMGDPVYGGGGSAVRKQLSDAARQAVDKLDHQALYAYKLGFLHPKSEE